MRTPRQLIEKILEDITESDAPSEYRVPTLVPAQARTKSVMYQRGSIYVAHLYGKNGNDGVIELDSTMHGAVDFRGTVIDPQGLGIIETNLEASDKLDFVTPASFDEHDKKTPVAIVVFSRVTEFVDFKSNRLQKRLEKLRKRIEKFQEDDLNPIEDGEDTGSETSEASPTPARIASRRS